MTAAGSLRDPATAVRVTGVSKWFGNVLSLNQVSLDIPAGGGVLALLGPNGAGKSTLLKLLTGQLRPSLGTVRLFGASPRARAARAQVGYCPDVDAFFEEMTGREFVAALLRLSGLPARAAREAAEAAVAKVGMEGRDVKLGGCSKGMRQRIKIAQAIAHQPKLLILDEPLSGLDPVGRRDLVRLFRELARSGVTVVVSSHVLSEIRDLAERVVVLASGRVVVDGSWAEVSDNLDHRPRELRLVSPDVRRLAAHLAARPETLGLTLERDTLKLATSDARNAADGVAEAVAATGAELRELELVEDWAESLFDIAAGAN